MKTGRLYALFLCFLFFTSQRCLASTINDDLKSYFGQLGFSSNVTSPHAFQGQSAGYYTGGSLFLRNRVRDIQIAHMEAPTYRSGCGGIDVYTGGISMINTDESVSALQNILNNGGSYAVTLALEESSPLIANGLKYWHQAEEFINQFHSNSCEMGEALVGGMWAKTRAAQDRVCRDVGTGTGYFSDYAKAHQGCGFDNKFNEAIAKGKDDPRYKDLVLDQGNLAWQAIQKNSFLKSNEELAYLFMTLSGTVIIQNNGKSIVVKPSQGADPRLIKALLYGGTANVYYCTDNKDANGCLTLGTKDITISPNQAAFDQLSSPVDAGGYADIIAADILFQYIEESVSLVKQSATLLPYPEAQFKLFQSGIESALTGVRAMRKNAYQEATRTTLLIEQSQFIEKMLAGSLSAQLSQTLSWAKGTRRSI
jgi:conjugative transfer pilus assembly protein TraH